MTIEKDGKTFAVDESLYSWVICRLFTGKPLRCKVSKRQCPNYCDFPASFIEEAVFAPLFILASFVKNTVPIGAWVYFWAFYLAPLVYISVFVPVPYCLDDCSFVVTTQSKSWKKT